MYSGSRSSEAGTAEVKRLKIEMREGEGKFWSRWRGRYVDKVTRQAGGGYVSDSKSWGCFLTVLAVFFRRWRDVAKLCRLGMIFDGSGHLLSEVERCGEIVQAGDVF
jgi:hypothetical protein